MDLEKFNVINIILKKYKITAGRLSTVIAIAIFLALLTLPLTVAGVSYAQDGIKKVDKLSRSEQNEITVISDIGPAQGYFPFHISELGLTVNNGTSENFNGEIIVKTNTFQYRVINVAVSPQTSKKYSLFIRLDKYSYNLKITLLNSRDIVIYDENVKLKPLDEEDYNVLAVCENSSFFSHFKIDGLERKVFLPRDKYESKYNKKNETEKNAKAVIYQYKPSELPGNSACLAPYSIAVLNVSDLSQLTAAQGRALIEYTANGGILFVSYGGFASRIANSPVAEVLPVEINGSGVIDHGDFYKTAYENFSQDEQSVFTGRNIALTLTNARAGAKVVTSFNYNGAAYPLIAFKNYGAGMVYFTAFDISEVDISRIKYLKDNITAMYKKSDLNSSFSLKQMADGIIGFSTGFNQALVQPPEPDLIIAVLCIFCVLVGPLFYYVNRSNTNMFKIIFYPLALSALTFWFFSASGFGTLIEKTQVYEFGLQLINNAESKIQSLSAVMLLQTPLSNAKYNVDASATSIYHQKGSYQDNSEILYDDETVFMLSPKMGYSLLRAAFFKNYKLNGRFTFETADAPADETKDGQPQNKNDAGKEITDADNYKKDLISGDRDALLKKFTDAINAKSQDRQQNKNSASIKTADIWNKTNNTKNKLPGNNAEIFRAPDGKKIISAVNNTEFIISSASVIYKNGMYYVGDLMPGDKINFDSAQKTFKKTCENSPEYIKYCLDTIMTQKVANYKNNRSDFSYGYYSNYNYIENVKAEFWDSLCAKVYELSQNSIILVGFAAGENTVSPSIKTKDCDIIKNGSLVVYTLN